MHEERLNTTEVKRFKSMLTDTNLYDHENGLLNVKNTEVIDTWLNDQAEGKQKVLD